MIFLDQIILQLACQTFCQAILLINFYFSNSAYFCQMLYWVIFAKDCLVLRGSLLFPKIEFCLKPKSRITWQALVANTSYIPFPDQTTGHTSLRPDHTWTGEIMVHQ